MDEAAEMNADRKETETADRPVPAEPVPRRGFLGRLFGLAAAAVFFPAAAFRRLRSSRRGREPSGSGESAELPAALRRPPAEVLNHKHLEHPSGWAG